MISVTDFKDCMDKVGFVIFENFVHPLMVEEMLSDLESAYSYCRKIQVKNGIENSEGSCHHLPAVVNYSHSFMAYLSHFERLDRYASSYFGGKYILSSFGGNLLQSDSNYANNIHRDQRSFSSFLPLMLNTLVMLDDFTVDNGATWLMIEGHKYPNKPTEEEFSAKAVKAVAPAGSVVMFNSNLWHRAGENRTNAARRSVTPMFSKPFIKSGFDYSKFVHSQTPEYIAQLLGYNSRVPASLDEWYRQPEDRFYKKDQG